MWLVDGKKKKPLEFKDNISEIRTIYVGFKNLDSISTVPAPLTAAVSNQKLSFGALDCHIKSK